MNEAESRMQEIKSDGSHLDRLSFVHETGAELHGIGIQRGAKLLDNDDSVGLPGALDDREDHHGCMYASRETELATFGNSGVL